MDPPAATGPDEAAADPPARTAAAPADAAAATPPDEPGADPPDRAADDPLVGQVLDGRYAVLRRLGAGAMGVVYEVLHQRLKKRLAMKVIHGELAQIPEFAARFEREALASSRIDHPNSIGVTDFGQTRDGELYLVMELVQGRSVEQLVAERPLPAARAMETAIQVLRALEHAHAAGVVHRDIKPENIMRIATDDGSWTVKVLDFGIAKAPVGGQANQLTQAGVVFGTPQYMAPEQAMSSDVDARADLYAVGATLWTMLTGEAPFDGAGPVEILSAKLTSEPPDLEQHAPGRYAPRLVQFMARALAREPSARFQSAAEMRRALERIVRRRGAGLQAAGGADASAALPARALALTQRGWNALLAAFSTWYRCTDQPQPPGWSARGRGLLFTPAGRVVLASSTAVLLLCGLVLALTLGGEAQRPGASKTGSGRTTTGWAKLMLPTMTLGQPTEQQKLLIRARLLLEKGACKEASVDLQNALSRDKSLAEARYLLGAALFCRRRYKAALTAYRQAVELDGRYRKDVRVLEHVERLLRGTRYREEAMKLVREQLGQAALPVLIRLANQAKDLELRHQAQALVTTYGKRDAIDWRAALRRDLFQLSTCKERCQAAEQVARMGGPKALAALRRARDQTVRYQLIRHRWRNGCCRQRLVQLIKQLLARQGE